jgi:ribosomal protein L40E
MRDLLRVIGGIIIGLGVLACLIFAAKTELEPPFKWLFAISTLASSALSGILFISIAEIIGLLTEILLRLDPLSKVKTDSLLDSFKGKRHDHGKDKTDNVATISEEQANNDNIEMGICPNCDAIIPLSSTECPKCIAVFGQQSTWKVLPK